jgi:hypothetical protein
MEVILKKYTNRDLYERDYPEEIEIVDKLVKAVEKARMGVSRARRASVKDPTVWIGYKVFNMDGDLKYKLPM